MVIQVSENDFLSRYFVEYYLYVVYAYACRKIDFGRNRKFAKLHTPTHEY